LIEDFLQGADQFGAGGIPLLVAQFDRLPTHQGQEIFWQLVGARHLGAFHEHRNDTYGAG
jgi:hypothetical protein